MTLSEHEAYAFLESLFPNGLKDSALIEELCPGGWENSPLSACYHPSPEQRYAESLEFSKNLNRLGLLLNRREDVAVQALPAEPEPTFEEILLKNPQDEATISPAAAVNEPAELLGLCLWDVFSDNHKVIAADGRVVDLGSFRCSAGVISDFYNTIPPLKEPDWSYDSGCGYMDFYMGTCWIGRRADLTPVYHLIFRRLKALGADWSYEFPRLHLIDFGPHEDDPSEPYNPSAALQKEADGKAKAAKLQEMRRKLDRDDLSAKRQARTQEPPATVQSYQALYGKFPIGWPPEIYPE